MTVGKQLTICIAGMLAVVLGLATGGWYSAQSLGTELNFATGTLGVRTMLSGQLAAAAVGMREKQRGMLMYALAHDRKRSKSNRDEFRERFHEAKAKIAAIQPLLTTRKGKELMASIDADLDKYSEYFEQTASLIAAGKVVPGLTLYRDSGSPIGTHLETASYEYVALQEAQLRATNAAGAERYSPRDGCPWSL
jgi:hypothetical protein